MKNKVIDELADGKATVTTKAIDKDGNPIVVYHGTDATFDTFDNGKASGRRVESDGYHFTDSEAVAREYGSKMKKSTLEISDPVTVDFEGKSRIYFDGKDRSPREFANRINEINKDIKNHYGISDELKEELDQFGWSDLYADSIDGIIAKNVSDNATMDSTQGPHTQYIVFSPSQIKSASAQSSAVPMPATTAKIDDSIAKLKGLKTAEVAPVITKLEDWKQAIQGQDLKNIELLRKQIGETFTAPEMAAVRSTGERVLSDIYGAVKEDMTDYIGEKGGQQALNKWQVANKELSKMMGDLDLTILKNTLEKGVDRPEVVKNMLFSKDRSVIQALNKNLTAKGRESARSAIMQEVGKKIGEDASPEKFLSEMRKLKNGGDPVGVFFTGDDLKAIEGLTRVLKATTRASQAGINPATGVQAVMPLSIIGMGGASVALEKYFGKGLPGLLASVGLVGAAGGGARLYESPTVRNILMKLPTVKPGSVEEGALFKRLLEAAQAVKPKKDETNER